MERLRCCNVLVGDFNARHRVWGEKCGDNKTNTYGTALLNFIRRFEYDIQEPESHTFRDISAIDHCVSNIGTKSVLVDKGALEHEGQIIKFNLTPTAKMNRPGINWRKVDRGRVKDNLDMVAGKDGGYDEILGIVNRLERKGLYRKSCGWWNKELEKMVKEVKFLGRSRDKEPWRLARKVLRNRLINKQYDYLKRTLKQAQDPRFSRQLKR